MAKDCWKSVSVWRNYGQECSDTFLSHIGPFFGPRCTLAK